MVVSLNTIIRNKYTKENMNIEELIEIGKNILEDNLENDTRINNLKKLVKDLPDNEREILKSVLFDFNKSLSLKDRQTISVKSDNHIYKLSESKLSDEEFWALIKQ